MVQKTIQLPKEEYEDIMDYMERLRETVEILTNTKTVEKIKEALRRMDSGEFLTKKDMSF